MKNKEFSLKLLNAIKEELGPVGASYLGQKFNLPPANIGRALHTLEKKGLLEKVSNKGRCLTQQGLAYLEQENQLYCKIATANKLIKLSKASSKKYLLEVLEARKLLECRAIELACHNITEEELKKLDQIMLEHLYEIKNGNLGSEQDLQLHLLITKASKNDIFYQILQLILTEKNAFTKFSFVADHVTETQLKQHDNIISALKKRDPDLARHAMLEHLNQVEQDIKRYVKDSIDTNTDVLE